MLVEKPIHVFWAPIKASPRHSVPGKSILCFQLFSVTLLYAKLHFLLLLVKFHQHGHNNLTSTLVKPGKTRSWRQVPDAPKVWWVHAKDAFTQKIYSTCVLLITDLHTTTISSASRLDGGRSQVPLVTPSSVHRLRTFFKKCSSMSETPASNSMPGTHSYPSQVGPLTHFFLWLFVRDIWCAER